MAKFREVRDIALRTLADHGVDDYSIEPTGSTHFRLRWEHNGKKLAYMLAASPSDRRVNKTIRADLRRMMRGINYE